jgi:Zn-dependent protease
VLQVFSLLGTQLVPFVTNIPYPSVSFIVDTMIILLISIDLHELGHALAADRLGDDTPRRSGHLTLNPFPKMGQLGLIMLVVLSISGYGFAFGFTPVNEAALYRRSRFGPAIVALAGPFVNLIIAIVAAIPLVTSDTLGAVNGNTQVFDFLNLMVSYNLLLFVLNLIPLPPLDGWTIFSAFLTPKTRYELRGLVTYGPLILIGLFIFDPYLHVISNIVYPLVNDLANLLSRIL